MKIHPAFLLFATLSVVSCHSARESEARKVVQLVGEQGSCSGSQVEAKSGATYILTAAHCEGIAVNGAMTVVRADGTRLQRKVIARSDDSDLLLIEGLPKLKGFSLGEKEEPQQHIHLIGHGLGLDTYRVDGVLIGPLHVLGFDEIASTAVAAPGHSGSPVIDDSGRVIGVVSVGNNYISGFVSLSDIQSFLAGY